MLVGIVQQRRQWPAGLLQGFDQVYPRFLAMSAPERFAKAFPPEPLAAADEIAGEKNTRRHLMLEQYREGMQGVVAPAVVERQAHSWPLRRALGGLQDVHQRHAVEVPAQPAQKVVERLGSDAQFVAMGEVGGVVIGQHPMQHQDHPGALQLIAPH